MNATIIENALKSSVRTGRVIIARYREDFQRSERPRIMKIDVCTSDVIYIYIYIILLEPFELYSLISVDIITCKI